MNEIQVFNSPEFGAVRTVIIEGEPWFVGKDVAMILQYERPTDAVRKRVDDEDRGVSKIETPSGKQNMTIINESGLYSLIFGSKLESAKRFKHWVTSEVLPQLRRTGVYGMPQLPQSPMQLLQLHYEAIKEVNGKVETLSGELSAIRSDLESFKNDMPILGIEESKITEAVRKKGVRLLGGKESAAYNNKSIRGMIYTDIYCQLKREFGISTYRAIKRNQTELALKIVEQYSPPMVLSERIERVNTGQVEYMFF